MWCGSLTDDGFGYEGGGVEGQVRRWERRRKPQKSHFFFFSPTLILHCPDEAGLSKKLTWHKNGEGCQKGNGFFPQKKWEASWK